MPSRKKTKRVNKIWTEEEENIIIMEHGLVPSEELAKRLGVKESQVVGKVNHLKSQGYDIKPKNYLQAIADKKRIESDIEYIKAHPRLTNKEIGIELDRSTNYIYVLRREHEIDFIKKGKTKLSKQTIANRKFAERKRKERDMLDTVNYNKAINRDFVNEGFVGGLRKKDVRVLVGDRCNVTQVGDRRLAEDRIPFRGKVAAQTKDHFTVRNKVRCETFLKVDVLLNEIILEVL